MSRVRVVACDQKVFRLAYSGFAPLFRRRRCSGIRILHSYESARKVQAFEHCINADQRDRVSDVVETQGERGSSHELRLTVRHILFQPDMRSRLRVGASCCD